jgi:putative DNA primase/helicase
MNARDDFKSVPEIMQQADRWVMWRYENDKKVPYQVDGRRADATEPASWATFANVVETLAAEDGYAGIGFVLGGGFAGVDLDDVLDESGELTPEAEAVVRELDTYTEVSPSGAGLKMFLLGRKPGDRCKTRLGESSYIEMYDGDRYFTVTGRQYGEAAAAAERTEALAALYGRTFANGSDVAQGPRGVMDTLLTDDEVVELVRRGNEVLWSNLRQGQPGVDASAEDFALCRLLAHYAGRDPVKVDRIFRQSDRMRAKWDERRGSLTYGERTVAAACAKTERVYRVKLSEAALEAWRAARTPEDLQKDLEWWAQDEANTAFWRSEEGRAQAAQAAPGAAFGEDRYTDTDNAVRLAKEVGDRVVYAVEMKHKWFIWDGCRFVLK